MPKPKLTPTAEPISSTDTTADSAHSTLRATKFLTLAREAIATHLREGRQIAAPEDTELRSRGACFVTLKRDGQLRGCIGSLRPQRPLGEDLVHNAIAAATQDPRFPPLDEAELAQVEIEISLLSAPEFLDVGSEAELLQLLRPGMDGLILFSGCRSATFLPQVWEQLPEPAQFLAALKHKAGLDPELPTPNLMAARYSVEKFPA